MGKYLRKGDGQPLLEGDHHGGYCTHGETFLNPEDILWWARGGKLKGESPARIAFLRGIVEGLPSPIEPVENWIAQIMNASPEEKKKRVEAGDFL